MNEKDWLTEVKELRAGSDPANASVRPKMDFVVELVGLRKRLGLTRAEVARRMGVAPPRVSEIESTPDKVSLDRIEAYARALGARFDLRLPHAPEELLAAQAGSSEIDVKAVGAKLRELATLLQPLTKA